MSGLGFFIFIGIAFLAWLMFSGKGEKESFLAYSWIAMIVVGSLHFIYSLLT